MPQMVYYQYHQDVKGNLDTVIHKMAFVRLDLKLNKLSLIRCPLERPKNTEELAKPSVFPCSCQVSMWDGVICTLEG